MHAQTLAWCPCLPLEWDRTTRYTSTPSFQSTPYHDLVLQGRSLEITRMGAMPQNTHARTVGHKYMPKMLLARGRSTLNL